MSASSPPPDDDSAPQGTQDDPGPQVGSVSEEAIKLLAALGSWAQAGRTDSGEVPTKPPTPEAGAHPPSGPERGEWWSQLRDHVGGVEGDCLYCPLCQMVAVVKRANPEVLTHFTSAASSALKGVAGLLESAGAAAGERPEGGGKGSTNQSFQHLDLDSDQDDSAW